MMIKPVWSPPAIQWNQPMTVLPFPPYYPTLPNAKRPQLMEARRYRRI